MKLSNKQIYEYGLEINKEFFNCDIKLPVKINFFLQKNIKKVLSLVQEIEETKINIGKEYGTYDSDDNSYKIKPENIDIVNKEIGDLFNLEQDVDIHIFKLDDFENIDLTYKQMEAIIFMIQE